VSVPEVIADPAAWQASCLAAREHGARIALVPTMGALHEGHLSLFREARRRADEGGRKGLALATIFVNPTQFAPGEDLSRYPRDLEGDLARCAAAGIDRVLAPDRPDRIFGAGHQTWVTVERTSEGLCGASRPGHFRGVATVVAKLLLTTGPCRAYFGEKDAQQLAIVRRLVRDLFIPAEIVPCPTVREPDGLAMSSRNRRLSPEYRAAAGCLFLALAEAAELAKGGERDAATLVAAMAREIGGTPEARLDYAAVVDEEAFAEVRSIDRPARALVAARFGDVRLIDNLALPMP